MLPSGKVVDQSTIDRHSEVESKWGRLPSDPFTGLEFNSFRRAVLDLPLKARIEKFLMENSEHFKSIPRSLGSSRIRRSRNRHASQFASLHNHNPSVGTYSSLLAYQRPATAKKTSATATLVSSQPAAKRARLSTATETASSHVYRVDMGLSSPLNTTTTATQTSATATATATLSLSSSIASSSTATQSNIEVAIQQALSKITRFTQPKVETKPACCIRCQSLQFTHEIQTCKHLVCRDCLVLLSQEQMCSCKTSFKGGDVQRYHKL